MSETPVSIFLAAVSQSAELTRRFLAVVEGKHSGEAIMAISVFAKELGYNLSFDDIRRLADGKRADLR